MRDYGAVSPQFWIGETGKRLRGKTDAQVLALYLMTSPHANMIGIFHCPTMYMSNETGMDGQRIDAALTVLIAEGFCLYDRESEFVFVVRMAAHQIGENLKPDDNKCKGVVKELGKVRVLTLKQAFIDAYKGHYHLSPFEAPSKPLPRGVEPPSKQLTGQDRTGTGHKGLPQSPGVCADSGSAGQDHEARTTRIGLLCKRIRQQAQLMGVNPHDPLLIALLDAGYSDDEIFVVCQEAAQKQKPWPWAHTVIQARRRQAESVQKVTPLAPVRSKFAGGI
jgi:hypothetical protein